MDLFTDGVSGKPGNSQCDNSHSIQDDVVDYPWVGASIYGNTIYSVEYITNVLLNAISDFSNSPTNTSFTFILPDWKNVQWYPLLKQFEIVQRHPTGSDISTCASTATYNADQLKPLKMKVGQTVCSSRAPRGMSVSWSRPVLCVLPLHGRGRLGLVTSGYVRFRGRLACTCMAGKRYMYTCVHIS